MPNERRRRLLGRGAALTGAAATMPWLGGCSVGAALAAVTPAGDAEREVDIAFGPDPRHRLDLYRPAAAAVAGGPAPRLLFIYGGSWNAGDRGTYAFVGRALAARGIEVAVADYRLYPQVRYPEFLRDGALALRWMIDQGPPRPTFVMGHSAGGYNAAMLALDPRWLGEVGIDHRSLAGWIGLAGPYDFLPVENPDVKPVFFAPNSPPDSQPINLPLTGTSRCLLGAAPDDKLVDPERNTGQLARRLRAAGVAVEDKLYPRTNHMTLIGTFALPLRWLAPVLDDVSRFVLQRPA